MADRIPFSIPGSLEPWIDVDHAIGVLGVGGTITRTFAMVTDAPSGGDCVFDLRDATADGGDGFTVTISDGTSDETTSGTLLAVASDETVYLRVEAANGAMNLAGWFEFNPTLSTDPVSTFLTTLSRVKTDEGIASGTTTFDAQISRIITGVSAQMESWMRRTIVDTTYTDEVYSGDGWTNQLVLDHHPITSTTTIIVKEDDVAVDTSLYSTDTDEGIIYKLDDNGKADSWSSGTRNYKVTYSAGYVGVPEDLAMAATAQVRHEFHQSQPAGENRLGLASNTDATGGSTAYVPGGLLPATIEAMVPYRRIL